MSKSDARDTVASHQLQRVWSDKSSCCYMEILWEGASAAATASDALHSGCEVLNNFHTKWQALSDWRETMQFHNIMTRPPKVSDFWLKAGESFSLTCCSFYFSIRATIVGWYALSSFFRGKQICLEKSQSSNFSTACSTDLATESQTWYLLYILFYLLHLRIRTAFKKQCARKCLKYFSTCN